MFRTSLEQDALNVEAENKLEQPVPRTAQRESASKQDEPSVGAQPAVVPSVIQSSVTSADQSGSRWTEALVAVLVVLLAVLLGVLWTRVMAEE